GVVRAMVLTPLPTQQSGIPPASSILASLGCKVPPVAFHALAAFASAGQQIDTLYSHHSYLSDCLSLVLV
ncbi:TPA: hypothetical protein ACK3O9_005978, partial [Burkholderia cepacia]